MKYQKKLKNNLRFIGNVPVKIFNDYLDDYYHEEKDLTPIQLKFESKKRNIDLIQKIYWWIVAPLTVGVFVSGILSLRKIYTFQYDTKFSSMIGNWLIIFVAYLILLAVIEIIIQSEKNMIYDHLTLINKKIKSMKEDKRHKKLMKTENNHYRV